MNRRGIGITVDVLFSLLLVSGVLLLFSSQPFVDPPSSSTFPLAASARDALGVLDKSGALSAQLVNRAFAADGVKAIHDAVLRLMPSDLNLKIRVTRFELADDLTDCDDLTAAGFDRCFPQSKRVSFEYAPETVVPETGFSHGRLSFVKYLPRPDIGSLNDNACVAEADFARAVRSPSSSRLNLQALSAAFDFNSRVTDLAGNPISQLSCDDNALLTVRARNDARNPLAIMLVLDSSGSMNAFDMNYRVSTGSLSGGVCTRQLLDVSGNDHNANNYGVAIGPPKHGSNSAAFSGQQYLEAPEAASLHADTLTISAWIYPTNLSRCNNGGNTCVIAGKESEYLLGVYFNGRVYFAIRNTSPGFNWTDANFIVSANTWTHVAFTYDGAMCRSYKNGVQAGAFACTGTITDASSALRIGARNGSYAASSVPTGPFVGNIDEFRVYDAALGVSDVLTLATSTTEPDANDLLLRYDFEDLSLDQNMPCFYRAPVLPGTNCNGGVISNNSIPASYTDFNSIATFNLSQADKNKIPAGSNLWISMDRGTPQQYASGVCSHIVLGNDIYKPPFLRVQKPTSPVTYYNFSTAYTQYLSQSQIPVGTQTVQVWNAASDPYNAADLNIYRYIQTPFVNIAGTVAVPASTFESEAKPQAPFSTDVAVSAQIFEAGPCTSSASWQQVGSVSVSDSNIYTLVFGAKYAKSAGSCGPHFEVRNPSGVAVTNLACPNSDAGCTVTAWSRTRTAASYAATGTYTLWMKSDTLLSADLNVYYDKYLFGAVGSGSGSGFCVISGSWTPLGSFALGEDMNQAVFLQTIRMGYTYPGSFCRPQLRVERPDGNTVDVTTCSSASGSLTCDNVHWNQAYRGPHAPLGTYTVYARSAYAFSTSYARQSYYDFLGLIYTMKNPPSANFVGGGTCSGEACYYNADSFAARSNCPSGYASWNSAFADLNSMSLARNDRVLDSISIGSTDSFFALRADVNVRKDLNSVCAGGVVGFSGGADLNSHASFPYPPTGGLGSVKFGVNYPSTVNANLRTPSLIPPSTYSVRGWDENAADFNVVWYLMRIDHAKSAAKQFLNALPWKDDDRLGLVDYDSNVRLAVDLTSDVNAVKSGVDSLLPDGETATGSALSQAIDRLQSLDGEVPYEKFIILLTDGETNSGPDPQTIAAQADAAGIRVITIGFGTGVDENELKSIASTPGDYFYASDAEALSEVFAQIVFKVQEGSTTSNVVIAQPPGIVFDAAGARCFTSDGTACTGTAANPGCECESISFKSDENLLAFYSAAVHKPDPYWWEGRIPFSVSCENFCSSGTVRLPSSASWIEDSAHLESAVSWTGGQTDVLVKVRDLAVRFLDGTVDPATKRADVNILLSNDGNQNIAIGNRTQGMLSQGVVSCIDGAPLSSCASGIAVNVFDTNADPDRLVCAFCTDAAEVPGLCARENIGVLGACPYPDSNHRYRVSDLPLGFLYATISPASATAPIKECALHNEGRISCLETSRPVYFVVDYWTWLK